MVAIDHFKQELTAQMGRASASGAKDVLINSLDLSGSILMGSYETESCCDAMQDAMQDAMKAGIFYTSSGLIVPV